MPIDFALVRLRPLRRSLTQVGAKLERMEPKDWIALGALLVAAIGVLTGAVLAPWMAARLAESGRIRDERSQAYTDALRLLHARVRELVKGTSGPIDDAEASAIMARLALYASDPTWDAFQAFFRPKEDLGGQLAEARGDDEIRQVHAQLERLVEQAADEMRVDLGTGRMMVEYTRRQRTRSVYSLPEEPTAP